jgi:hypothetical protein
LTKEILIQYCDLKEEIRDLEKRIQDIEDRLVRIEEDGAVTDSVTCGRKGKKPLGTIKISGFPFIERRKVKTSLQVKQLKYSGLVSRYLELTNDVDDYINNLGDSRMRRILRFRYLDDMTWLQVANSIGGITTADSVRMEHDRFFET